MRFAVLSAPYHNLISLTFMTNNQPTGHICNHAINSNKKQIGFPRSGTNDPRLCDSADVQSVATPRVRRNTLQIRHKSHGSSAP